MNIPLEEIKKVGDLLLEKRKSMESEVEFVEKLFNGYPIWSERFPFPQDDGREGVWFWSKSDRKLIVEFGDDEEELFFNNLSLEKQIEAFSYLKHYCNYILIKMKQILER